jgi:uncharacterized protein
MLKEFKCIDGCSDCCYYREYYPSLKYGKIGVILLPEEKMRIEALAKSMNIKINILPRLGIGKSTSGLGPNRIIAYQIMGKQLDGNLCPFLSVDSSDKFPNQAFRCNIYKERPLACRAYPVIEENGMTTTLDNKCQFCTINRSTLAGTNGLEDEILSLVKIKSKIKVAQRTEIWRYATAIGEPQHKQKLLPQGWVLENL